MALLICLLAWLLTRLSRSVKILGANMDFLGRVKGLARSLGLASPERKVAIEAALKMVLG